MLLLNPFLSFLHDTYCCFSSQKFSYCISYILHVVWLSVLTISLSIHRWEQHTIFSLSAYESPSNEQDHVLSIPRLPDNPELPGGCYLDCFQRSCGDIAGSGKRENFLFLVIIVMVIFKDWGFIWLIHVFLTCIRSPLPGASNSLSFKGVSRISLTNQSSKTGDQKNVFVMFW